MKERERPKGILFTDRSRPIRVPELIFSATGRRLHTARYRQA